ncbi:MAG: YbaN family protein [Deltaproteobacteria bacterium]|nr:YbaN family protein [Deltaproteobacteria bacterium]
MKRIVRILLLSVGFISLGLGFAGLFLPLLPTTPFILLSGWCFAKGSPKWNRWIHRHREFGPLIENWNRDRSISKKHKFVACLTLTGSIVFILSSEMPVFPRYAVIAGLSTIFLFLYFTKTSPPRNS